MAVRALQTGAWPDATTHVFTGLKDRGVLVSLNSDDPSIQGSTLSTDYVIARRAFHLSMNDFLEININSLKASFLPLEEKN